MGLLAKPLGYCDILEVMKVVIAGYGIEGRASYDYYASRGHEVVVADERMGVEIPEGVSSILGEGAFDSLSDFDLIVRSPGISPKKLPYGDKVWSATNEFFNRAEELGVTIVGVTGTKGKGTTCSLITSILEAAGQRVHLVGNIGRPALESLADVREGDIVVYELSSFQLWDLKRSPHIAVVLMIEPDHLDIHDGVDDYVSAKANIRRFQSLFDICVYHPTSKLSEMVAATTLIDEENLDEYGGSIAFADRYAIKAENQVYVQDGYFCVQNRKICSVDNLVLPGVHNLENTCAAMSAVSELWLGVTDDQYAKGLRQFKGLPHRLKIVGEIGGVKFYDDSISTTPGSSIAAIRSFSEPKYIILGGSDKGADYEELISECKKTDTTVIAIGETGEKIVALCQKYDVSVESLGTAPMDEVVKNAYENAVPGSVVLLSPASASFDMYKSYSQRGEAFIAAVDSLKEEAS